MIGNNGLVHHNFLATRLHVRHSGGIINADIILVWREGRAEPWAGAGRRLHSSHFCGVFAVAQGNTHEFSVSVSVKRRALCSGTFLAGCIPIPLQVVRALLAKCRKGLLNLLELVW